MNVPEVFDAIANLVIDRNQHPLKQYPNPLHVPVDDQWQVWVNGQMTEREIVDAPESSMAHRLKVPRCTAAVFFNGWLAGFVDPAGGTVAAGEVANEDTLLAALKAARDAAGGGE